MKLKYELETVNMGEEIVAVPVGRESYRMNGVLKLNREGKEILELLKDETTEEAVVDALAARYENKREELAGYVHSAIRVFRENGLLEE